jgi:mono/diheme cytochrome c family protein
LKPDEIDAVAAWVLAEGLRLTEGLGNGSGSAVEISEEQVGSLDRDRLFVLGDRVSRQHACYQCHGELGQGGVPNPESFKGVIPGFFGSEFLELTDGGDRAEILHWIEHGRGADMESGVKGVFSKRFFDGQAIGMPGYDGVLSDGEKALLVDFMLLLNEKGPLSARDVEKVANLLTGGGSDSEPTNSNN